MLHANDRTAQSRAVVTGISLARRRKLRRLILTTSQSPGDVVMLTAAVRDLHLSYPGKFLTDVRTACPAIWMNNPFVTALRDEPGMETVECHYPLIHHSNTRPVHFLHGYIDYLSTKLRMPIRPTAFKGDIHLSDAERGWMSQVHEITGEDTPFWIICAGGKYDFTIKWWDTNRWQRVVDCFRGRILFVQVGELAHNHPPLSGVIDLRGKTDLRQLIRLVYHADGVLCPVTCLMHLAAAVPVPVGRPKNRACVVVAGGREPMQWEAYPHHQYIHSNGQLRCCDNGGCWKSRTVPLGDGDEKDQPQNLCIQPVETRTQRNAALQSIVLPRCMEMITPDDVIRRIENYYLGGALDYLSPGQGARGLDGADRGVSLPPEILSPLAYSKMLDRVSGPTPSGQKMIAVTIGVGRKWKILAELAAKSCRENTGLETYILDEDAMVRYGFSTPHHLKYKLFHEFPDADSILYFDADVVFLQSFPAHAFLGRKEFVCVRDRYESSESVNHEARMLGLRPEEYFNSGFFIVHRAVHEIFLEKAQWLTGRRPSRFKDQSYLNGARHMLGSPILYLPRKYNMLAFDLAADTSQIVIGHFHKIDERPIGKIRKYHAECRVRGRASAARNAAKSHAELQSLLASYSTGPAPARVNHRDAEEEARYKKLLLCEVSMRRTYPRRRFRGRGIIVCGGGKKYFPSAWVTIRMLRDVGCSLPIELWHLGPSEITRRIPKILAPHGVRAVNADDVRREHPVGILRGYELKVFALVHCRFSQVLLLDADNVPTRDPSYLFEEPEYVEKGSIFWPDFGRLQPSRSIWRLMGLKYRDEPEFESGQVLLNKAKCWKALCLAMHLNEQSDFYYRHIHGDKETFHMAWARLRQPYAMPARKLEGLEATMCQHDLQGRRIFQHRNGDKWRLEGENRVIPGFQFEDRCRTFIEELRTMDLEWEENGDARE